MPIPPPSSISSQPPPAGGVGLSRTRSLRRPQAGPSAQASTSQTSQANAQGTTASARGASPSRLPVKPTAGTTTLIGQKPRPPSATGGLASARLRRPDAATASITTSSTTTTTRPATKPPSSSRSHLISSGPGATASGSGLQRRPTSSSGRPTSSSGRPTSSGGPSSSSEAPSFSQMTRTRSAAGSSTTATSATTSAPVRGHVRNKSASIVTGSSSATRSAAATTTKPPLKAASRPPSATTLSSATVLRPPSAQSSSTASSGTASRPPTRGAASASSTAATTSSTVHRRNASAATASATATSAAAHRPAFSTHQQHYSPAKNLAPKPRIAAILAPPASPSKKPANVALSVEIGRLQTTLLQLHLLHRDSAAVTAEWHASARQALAGERLSALAADHAELVQMAGKRAESVNAMALHEWGNQYQYTENGSMLDLTLEEKIQALDAVLAGVWSLAGQDHSDAQSHAHTHGGSSSTSRYVQVVRRFERWAQQTADLVAARQGIDTLEDLMDEESSGDEGGKHGRNGVASGFLSNEKEPLLDAAWHEECGNLVHRLEGWQRQLDQLGRGVIVDENKEGDNDTQPQSQSSLHRMLSGCRSLVDGMLDELHMMQQLEHDAAEQELAWIRQMNATAGVSSGGSNGSDLQGSQQQPARAGAIWRAM